MLIMKVMKMENLSPAAVILLTGSYLTMRNFDH